MIVIDRVAILEALSKSVACTVNVDMPLDVGVPLITPLEESARLTGRLPETIDQVQIQGRADSVAVSVWLYATPTSPPGNELVVMVGCALATPAHSNAIATAPAHLYDKHRIGSPGTR
jgi:hypothetical protein